MALSASFPPPAPVRTPFAMHWMILRFGLISLSTAVVDNLVFYFAFRATGTIAGAQAAAKIVALLFQYLAVRRSVFLSDERHGVLFPRYVLMAAAYALVSYAGIRVLSRVFTMGVMPAKILTETLLFTANFIVQRHFVFSRRAT